MFFQTSATPGPPTLSWPYTLAEHRICLCPQEYQPSNMYGGVPTFCRGDKRSGILNFSVPYPFLRAISCCQKCLAAAYSPLHVKNTCTFCFTECACLWKGVQWLSKAGYTWHDVHYQRRRLGFVNITGSGYTPCSVHPQSPYCEIELHVRPTKQY